MDNPKSTSQLGTLTEGVILAALLRAGKNVLIPFGVARYDLAIDEDGRLVRVQCKTARLRNGVILFNTRSVKRDGTQMHYRGDADLFGVHCPETWGVYMVPVELVGESVGMLRVTPPLNNQRKGVIWAQDYALA
jgi:hypothetical protein